MFESKELPMWKQIIAVSAAIIAAANAAHAKPLPLGANAWTTLYATFDRDLHAGHALKNPYSGGSNAGLAAGGVQGKALRAPNRLSVVVFSGANLPSEKGTVRLWVKSPAETNIWNDGKEYFLAAAERNSPFRINTPEIMQKLPGFNWLLYKSATGEITFGLNNTASAYIRVSGELPPHPMPIGVRVPCADRDAKAWHEVTVSWDVARRKIWLRVDDTTSEGTMPAEFQAGAFDYLMLATHPNFYSQRQSVFPGLIDELLVSNRTLDEWMSDAAPTQARRDEAPPPNWARSEAKLFNDEPLRAIEAQYRTSLDTQARFQNAAGGWNYSFSYPAGMGFMSGKVRSPLPTIATTTPKTVPARWPLCVTSWPTKF